MDRRAARDKMPPVLRTGEAEWFRRGADFVIGQEASSTPQSSRGQLDGGGGVGVGQCVCV